MPETSPDAMCSSYHLICTSRWYRHHRAGLPYAGWVLKLAFNYLVNVTTITRKHRDRCE